MPIAHGMSPVGTFETSRDVRVESAFGGMAEVAFRGLRSDSFDPTRTFVHVRL